MSFVIGYNQAWLAPRPETYPRLAANRTAMSYGRDMVANFDERAVRWMLQTARQSGGSAVRLWAFEGPHKEGIVFDGLRPTGLQPAFLQSVNRIMAIARQERVRIYWTALSGNWPANWMKPEYEVYRGRHSAILTDTQMVGQLVRFVLVPFLGEVLRYPDALFGLDLVNEVDASLERFWGNQPNRLRLWVANLIRGLAPAVGHSRRQIDITISVKLATSLRLVRGLGLDFYDIHIYNDDGVIPLPTTYGLDRPLVLGEFGQSSRRFSNETQSHATNMFLRNALSHGYSAAFAWRLIDWPRTTGDYRHSYYLPARRQTMNRNMPTVLVPRPAVDGVRRFAAAIAPRVPVTRESFASVEA